MCACLEITWYLPVALTLDHLRSEVTLQNRTEGQSMFDFLNAVKLAESIASSILEYELSKLYVEF